MLILFVGLAIAFIGLGREVRSEETLKFDRQVLLSIHNFASPALDSAMKAITHLGGIVFVPLATLFVSIWLAVKKHYVRSLLIMIDVGGAAILAVVLKLVYERPRPDLWDWLVTENTFSFPSGHAMASMSLALAVIFTAWHSRYRIVSIILAGLYVPIIAFTRLYLGVHYPSDILAGWLVSAAWVVAVWLIFHLASKGRLIKLIRQNQKR